MNLKKFLPALFITSAVLFAGISACSDTAVNEEIGDEVLDEDGNPRDDGSSLDECDPDTEDCEEAPKSSAKKSSAKASSVKASSVKGTSEANASSATASSSDSKSSAKSSSSGTSSPAGSSTKLSSSVGGSSVKTSSAAGTSSNSGTSSVVGSSSSMAWKYIFPPPPDFVSLDTVFAMSLPTAKCVFSPNNGQDSIGMSSGTPSSNCGGYVIWQKGFGGVKNLMLFYPSSGEKNTPVKQANMQDGSTIDEVIYFTNGAPSRSYQKATDGTVLEFMRNSKGEPTQQWNYSKYPSTPIAYMIFEGGAVKETCYPTSKTCGGSAGSSSSAAK